MHDVNGGVTDPAFATEGERSTTPPRPTSYYDPTPRLLYSDTSPEQVSPPPRAPRTLAPSLDSHDIEECATEDIEKATTKKATTNQYGGDDALVWWTSHWCGGRRTGAVDVALVW